MPRLDAARPVLSAAELRAQARSYPRRALLARKASGPASLRAIGVRS